MSNAPIYEKMAQILNVLGDADALKMLNEAAKGFKSGKETIKELKLTPRKYYRTLREFTDAGITANSGNEYKLSPLGEFVRSLLLADLSSFLLSNQNSTQHLQEISRRKQLMVIDDYKKFINFLVTVIDNSKSEILLGTRFVDFAVIQSLSYALERGIKLQTLNDTKLDYPSFFKLVEEVLRDIRPRISKFFVDAEKNHRSANVPISFIIIDKELALFELPNKQFRIAFVSSDKEIVKLLTDFFLELWDQSKSLNVPSWKID